MREGGCGKGRKEEQRRKRKVLEKITRNRERVKEVA